MDRTVTFEKIYESNRARIIRYLTRLVGEAEAEDLAQEVFIKVSKSLDGFRDESNVLTWIYRIATNTALDRLRSPSFKVPEPIGDMDLVPLEAMQKSPTVEQRVIKAEMSGCVRRMVDRLPGTYRTVIVLSEIEGFKDSEIADILGMKLSAAKIALHRARARLKKILSENCVFYRSEENELACDRSPGARVETDDQVVIAEETVKGSKRGKTANGGRSIGRGADKDGDGGEHGRKPIGP